MAQMTITDLLVRFGLDPNRPYFKQLGTKLFEIGSIWVQSKTNQEIIIKKRTSSCKNLQRRQRWELLRASLIDGAQQQQPL